MNKKLKIISIILIFTIFAIQSIVWADSLSDSSEDGVYESPNTLATYVEKNQENFVSSESFNKNILRGSGGKITEKSVPKAVFNMMGKKMNQIYANTTSTRNLYKYLSCIDANHKYSEGNQYQIVNIIDIGYSDTGKSVDVYKYYNKYQDKDGLDGSFTKTTITDDDEMQNYAAKMAYYIYALGKYNGNTPINKPKSLLIRTLALMCNNSDTLNDKIYTSIRPYMSGKNYRWVGDTEDQNIDGKSMKTLLNNVDTNIDVDKYAKMIKEEKFVTSSSSDITKMIKDTSVKPQMYTKVHNDKETETDSNGNVTYQSRNGDEYDGYVVLGPFRANTNGDTNGNYSLELKINGENVNEKNFKLYQHKLDNGSIFENTADKLRDRITADYTDSEGEVRDYKGRNFYIKYNYKADGKNSADDIDVKKIKVTVRQNYGSSSSKIIQARLALICAPVTGSMKHSHQNVAIYGSTTKNGIGQNSKLSWKIDDKMDLIVKKVDENGDPLEGVEFEVYKDDKLYKDKVCSNAEGKAVLSNVEEGVYYAKEISTHDNSLYSARIQNYPTSKKVWVKKDADENEIVIEMENKQYTNLSIHKTVKNNPNVPIKGAKFKVQYSEDKLNWYWVNYYKDAKNIEDRVDTIPLNQVEYYDEDENGNAIKKQRTIKEYETDSDGYYNLEAIPVGFYRIVELSVPEPYIVQPYTCTKNKDGTYTYTAWKDNTSNYIECKPISDMDYTANTQYKFTFECADPQIFKISGYVFTPFKSGKNEESVDKHDSKYQEYKYVEPNEEGDKVLANATVKLLKDGELYTGIGTNKEEIVGTVTTNQNGYYEYKIEMGEYDNKESDYVNKFAVQFVYDGIDFIAWSPNYKDETAPRVELTEGATSKATESTDTSGRKAYDPITGVENPKEPSTEDKGYGTNIANKQKESLTYEWEEGKNNQGTTGTSKSIIKNFLTGYDNVIGRNYITINESGDKVKNQVTSQFTLDGTGKSDKYGNTYNYENYSIKKNGHLSEVTQINLGLITREKPDLSLTNTIVNVKTTINGFENTYGATRSKEENVSTGVTYVTDSQLSSFTLYKADISTVSKNETNDNRLKVYITYKIDITNNTNTLYGKANEIALFYDPEYTLKEVYIGTLSTDGKTIGNPNNLYDENENIQEKTTTSKTPRTTQTNNNRKVAYIDTSSLMLGNLEDKEIGNTKSIFVTYQVNDQEIKNMFINNNYTPTFKNVAEINSYTTYEDKDGKIVYAGIDCNSAPGNVPDNIDLSNDAETKETMTPKFDNDTGYAEEFRLEQKDDRTLEGQVFLDNSTLEGTGKERKSDGKYDSNTENAIENYGVQLIEIETDSSGKIQVNTDGAPVEKTINKLNIDELKIEQVSSEEQFDGLTRGQYRITGFIPGYYVIKYTYNNNTYYVDAEGNEVGTINALDYKSAVISSENISAHGDKDYTTTTENLTWYKSDNVESTDKVIGNTIAEKINNLRNEANKKQKYTEAIDNWNTRQNIDRKKVNYETSDQSFKIDSEMNAYTPTFAIQVELNTLSDDNSMLPKSYNIFNMDFGITERAKQKLSIEKKVSNIKITLANGQVLLDGNPNEPSELKQMSGVKYVPSSPMTEKGLVDIELDSELIHGSRLEVTYSITVKNEGEKDYYNEGYYAYGNEFNNEVKITPQIYDYVDNKLTFEKGEQNWKVVTLDDMKDTKDDNNEELILVSDEAKANIEKINTILHYTGELCNDISVGEDKKIDLTLIKTLSNNEDLEYDNDIEIVNAEYSTNGARRFNVQLGQYMSGEDKTLGIGNSSETITITPPTGEDKDYTMYIIAGIGALLILATGIIIIKKKVLK